MPLRVAVVGAGSWGTTVASLACHNGPTLLWARREELAREIDGQHTNRAYLAGFTLPEQLRATSSLEEAVGQADVVVMAVPSHGFRTVIGALAASLPPSVPVVNLAKGLEVGTRLRMTEVVHELLPGHPAGVLTGPNLAKEIMRGYPAAAVLGMSDQEVALDLQPVFASPWFRVYTNPDVVGCELAGALKNVMAIAAGMADGMGFGDNTKAAMITRGLAEMSRLGVALGGDPHTFTGLAGMGDLVATCSSTQSRNHFVGEQLGRGHTLAEVVGRMNMVAEGVKSSAVVVELAAEHGVEMPIAEQVRAVCHDGRPAAEAVAALMSRRQRSEVSRTTGSGAGG